MDEKHMRAYSNAESKEELISRLPIPGPGRPKETEIDKIKKKAIKEHVAEYKERLAEALPLIDPVLIEKAKSGDIQAIREINDIIVDKAVRKTDITSGDKPIAILGGITQKQDEV